jgi:predicted nucleic acid-binding protein
VIVIDASALVAYLLGEEDLERYLHEDLYSLDLVIKEAANALTMAFRQAWIDEASLRTCYRALIRFAEIIEFKPQLALMDSAFALALREDLTVYDSLYIELTKEMNARLLSLDQKQRKVAEKERVVTIP